MPNIISYQDYRQFLGDYYEEKKAILPTFSYQSFSQKAGFASKSFVFNVIKGKNHFPQLCGKTQHCHESFQDRSCLFWRIWYTSINPPISPSVIFILRN